MNNLTPQGVVEIIKHDREQLLAAVKRYSTIKIQAEEKTCQLKLDLMRARQQIRDLFKDSEEDKPSEKSIEDQAYLLCAESVMDEARARAELKAAEEAVDALRQVLNTCGSLTFVAGSIRNSSARKPSARSFS
jgi:hypothetical protein